MQKGIAASPGIVIGKAYVLGEQEMVIDRGRIPEEYTKAEICRFDEALVKTRSQLEEIYEKAVGEFGIEKAEIFAAHLMILNDMVFLDEIKEKILIELITAENAADQVTEKYASMFGNMDDLYLKERAADIKDIMSRLLKNLLGIKIRSLKDIDEEVVIIARDLAPSDIAQMDKKLVKAFATDIGGKTSHTAIMARSLSIPAVVGLKNITKKTGAGDTVIIDGNLGLVYIDPDELTLEEYKRKKERYIFLPDELAKLKDQPCATICGKRRVDISANTGSPEECEIALANGADGIGLYRTEFLYMDRADLPDEEEQFEVYKTVAEAMSERPVIIRTLDIGGDKKTACLNMPEELNPFLGCRAIRLCMENTDMFKTQLKAILRASHYGKLRVMYPMISGAFEIRRANAALAEAKAELDKTDIPYDKDIEVGIMVEIPSAAIIADILIREVDFFSIGTNDLIQYTIAVDRMNERISYLYEPLHPAVLRLIKNVIDASHHVGKWTGMCGEMAGDIAAAPILLGMGLDEFSMSSTSIPGVKNVIRSLTYDEAKEIAAKALIYETPEEIRNLTKDLHN